MSVFQKFAIRGIIFAGLGLLVVFAFKYDETNKDDGMKMVAEVFPSYYHSGKDEGPEKGGRWFYNVFVPETMSGSRMLELECSLTLEQYKQVVNGPKIRDDERSFALVLVYIGALFNEIHCEHLQASSEFSEQILDMLAEEDPTDYNNAMYRYKFGHSE